jgi:hypothetical protein
MLLPSIPTKVGIQGWEGVWTPFFNGVGEKKLKRESPDLLTFRMKANPD